MRVANVVSIIDDWSSNRHSEVGVSPSPRVRHQQTGTDRPVVEQLIFGDMKGHYHPRVSVFHPYGVRPSLYVLSEKKNIPKSKESLSWHLAENILYKSILMIYTYAEK